METTWSQVVIQITSFMSLDNDWDGRGSDKIPQNKINKALALASYLNQANYDDPPNDIYPLPDGDIVFEWQMSDEVIRRLFVEDESVQEMITFAHTPAIHRPFENFSNWLESKFPNANNRTFG